MAVPSLNRSLPYSFRVVADLSFPRSQFRFRSSNRTSCSASVRASLISIHRFDPGLCCLRLGQSCLQVMALDPRRFSSGPACMMPRIAINESTRTYVQQTTASVSLKVNSEHQTSASWEKMVAVRDTVELTELEGRIFAILTATLEQFGLQTQLRVAGGWVRDKLLGRHSIDIDIALDDMVGRVFCEKVNEHLLTIGEETHSVGVIQSNPDQSKHLETANMRVLGMSIDFVNLRAETYSENSRIPEVEFGTPEQDAYRRDLTINSLFYNINTRLVEDFTGQGIADLKSGIIRTPLPPNTTFLDDPLRVCRAIRFGARFNFELDDELKKAAASENVRTALGNKVSRERIGHEIDLMLMGNQPAKAMEYLDELCLFSAVFRIHKDSEPDPPVVENYGRLCVNALRTITKVLGRFRYAAEINHEQRRLLLLGALFLPLHPCSCFLDNKKKKKIPVSTHIIRESLKLKVSDASRVEALHSTALKFKQILKQLLQADFDNLKDREDAKIPAMKHRVDLGLLLVDSKELWRDALLLSAIMELPSVSERETEVGLLHNNDSWIEEKAVICNTVEDIVIKLGGEHIGLTKVWEVKLLVGGDEIMATLKLGKGKQVQEWKDRVLRWQLAHPHSTAEDCHDWLLEENVKRLKSQ